MLIRKQFLAIQNWLKCVINSDSGGCTRLMARLVGQLIRFLFRFTINHPRLQRSAGFILPTTVLLLLVVSLAVGSISLRTLSRTQQTIGQRQQQVIYNAATPAIDRAKAKLELLFDKDDRFLKKRVNGEDRLHAMMLNDGITLPAYKPLLLDGTPVTDPYTFPDDDETSFNSEEERIDLDGDGDDNAWKFKADTDGNGLPDAWVAYSILFDTPADIDELEDTRDPAVQNRANSLQVRHGPLSLAAKGPKCKNITSNPIAGWLQGSTSTAERVKNFQVNAVVVPAIEPEDPNGDLMVDSTGTVATIEFHQDRKINTGNKWGAWFRNDFEVFPGPKFNWNGAIHTDSNILIGKPAKFEAFLISSEHSCLNTSAEDSEIVFGETNGQIISGRVDDKDEGNQANLHVFQEIGKVPLRTVEEKAQVNQGNHSVKKNDPTTISSLLAPDAVSLITENKLTPRGLASGKDDDYAKAVQEGDWEPADTEVDNRANRFDSQIVTNESDTTQADDVYRADNRAGPAPAYDTEGDGLVTLADLGKNAGDVLTAADNAEIFASGSTAYPDDPTGVALDGYWENRARVEGMRVIVGQRLELSEPLEVFDGTSCDVGGNNEGRCHEARQRRTWDDNLSAVQATAVYHANPRGSATDNDQPLACLATTVHPGTPETLENAATFLNLAEGGTNPAYPLMISDFFNGYGTNGWEFEAPSFTAGNFNLSDSSSAMSKALKNLAHFAGDPNGGAPSFNAIQTDGVQHPYPEMAKWGDFSILRRILDGSSNYASLSPADKTTLQTSACMLGMLAYNVNYLTTFNYGEINESLLKSLNTTFDPNSTLARFIATKEQVELDLNSGYEPSASDLNFCPAEMAALDLPALAALCPSGHKYPILYSLFPEDSHADTTRGDEVARPYDGYISGENASYNYAEVNPAAIALKPKARGSWALPSDLNPAGVGYAGNAPNNNGDVLIVCEDEVCSPGATGTRTVRVGFKDSALYDGRQLMSVRTLDLNMDLLRQSEFGTGDYWLPLGDPTVGEGGIIYAFREDALREDSIVRPATGGASAGTCSNDIILQSTGDCQMNAADPDFALMSEDATDPPLATNGISLKPIDYYADPDRRPYGFRLKRGKRLDRDDDNGVGIAFISDDPVYISGDFNWHQSLGSNLEDPNKQLQEFTDKLDLATYDDFYGRGADPTKLDENFATPDGDSWRSAEVMSDAVTILSNNFCDGSVADIFEFVGSTTKQVSNVDTKYGCNSSLETTSYLNQPLPADASWVRQGGGTSTPYVIRPSGNPAVSGGTGEFAGNFGGIRGNRDNRLLPGTRTTVNAGLYSRIIPSRETQSYGGLHNFPRFIESWEDDNGSVSAIIQGAFYQLDFSRLATAPYDQLVWEPRPVTSTPTSSLTEDTTQAIFHEYYNPPGRAWGYDVALQFAPAGPIASRLISPDSSRSEFYTEPPVNDPYIYNLCRTLEGEGAICPAP
ncbi:MAG: hormogonium polysaccharide biosynthesis protein HpsA [Cyanobacteria bacterium P01_F01_bin.150]